MWHDQGRFCDVTEGVDAVVAGKRGAQTAMYMNIASVCTSIMLRLRTIQQRQQQAPLRDNALLSVATSMQVVCSRCTATADMAFASDAVASGNQQGRAGSIQVSSQCPNCHQDWSASLTPRFVHAHSNVLASLRAQGCSPQDVLPSLMAAQCSNCSAAASLR